MGFRATPLNGMQLRGCFRVYYIVDDEPFLLWESQNLITDLGASAVTRVLNEDFPALGTYVALGDSAVAPAASSIELGNELYRAQKISGESDEDNVTLTFFVPAGDALFTWSEIGIFSAGATSAEGDGSLYSHALINPAYDHSGGNVDLQIDWEMSVVVV